MIVIAILITQSKRTNPPNTEPVVPSLDRSICARVLLHSRRRFIFQFREMARER